jgi:hypothetical protein
MGIGLCWLVCLTEADISSNYQVDSIEKEAARADGHSRIALLITSE